jgi:hypothetical protein
VTQRYEQGRQDGSRLRSSGAPWPLVERRMEARPLELGSPLARVPRQTPAPDVAPVRRVLAVERRTGAWWRSRVLLADLVGVVLLVLSGRYSIPCWSW